MLKARHLLRLAYSSVVRKAASEQPREAYSFTSKGDPTPQTAPCKWSRDPADGFDHGVGMISGRRIRFWHVTCCCRCRSRKIEPLYGSLSAMIQRLPLTAVFAIVLSLLPIFVTRDCRSELKPPARTTVTLHGCDQKQVLSLQSGYAHLFTWEWTIPAAGPFPWDASGIYFTCDTITGDLLFDHRFPPPEKVDRGQRPTLSISHTGAIFIPAREQQIDGYITLFLEPEMISMPAGRVHLLACREAPPRVHRRITRLGSGWYDLESDGETSWRWMTDYSVTFLQNRYQPMQLFLEAWMPPEGDGEANSVSIRINRQTIESFHPGSAPFSRLYLIPESLMGPDAEIPLEISVTGTGPPLPNDPRKLGLMLRRFQWREVPP